MSELFTKSTFESTVKDLSGCNTFSSHLNESRHYNCARKGQITIFLSHSHLDAKYVNMARLFFENLGIQVYVDWADETMPKSTSGKTAEIIKDKIKSNYFFVFLATNNSLKSKWCNWELGYGDAYKFSKNKIVILPIIDNDGSWEGNEYLQLYPFIKHDRINHEYYIVYHDDSKRTSLVSWLNYKNRFDELVNY